MLLQGKVAVVAGMERAASLNRTATLADVGLAAAWMASDQARTLTATEVNISCGALFD